MTSSKDMTTTTTRYLAIAEDFLHVTDRPMPDSLGSLNYDWRDFASEFQQTSGQERYLIDERLKKFLAHFFGPAVRAWEQQKGTN